MTDLIVDTNSLYARSWYATTGRPYDALVGTINMSLMCLNPNRVGEKIDRVMFCWDGGQKKDKGRDPRPAAYNETQDDVKACLGALYGADNVRIEPYEADDIIATAATISQAEHIIIATGDKDLCQLQNNRTSIFDTASKGMISRREMCSKWPIKLPVHLSIVLAIQGDQADNIPGIKGWGPKRVKKLFESVTKEMDFEAALAAIVAQIPEDKQPEFYEALDLTMLNTAIPDVPVPKPLQFVDPGDLSDLGLGDVFDHYRRVWGIYTGEDSEAALMRRADSIMDFVDKKLLDVEDR